MVPYVGSRPIPAGWLAGCSSVGRYSDVAGVSQFDWPHVCLIMWVADLSGLAAAATKQNGKIMRMNHF